MSVLWQRKRAHQEGVFHRNGDFLHLEPRVHGVLKPGTTFSDPIRDALTVIDAGALMLSKASDCPAGFRASPARIAACAAVLRRMPRTFIGALVTDPRAEFAKLGCEMALSSQRRRCKAA
ncbi:hypothetical protein PPGU19_086570 (plasmid) [Paraburkholderia sp. PGU19]|nr:hypothetical protein PPGU19_086570 [Paraburkholderia sp. PGU19]